jgi:hypothetical protein
VCRNAPFLNSLERKQEGGHVNPGCRASKEEAIDDSSGPLEDGRPSDPAIDRLPVRKGLATQRRQRARASVHRAQPGLAQVLSQRPQGGQATLLEAIRHVLSRGLEVRFIQLVLEEALQGPPEEVDLDPASGGYSRGGDGQALVDPVVVPTVEEENHLGERRIHGA